MACDHIRSAIANNWPRLPVVRVIALVKIDTEVVDRSPIALCETCCQWHGLSGDSTIELFEHPIAEGLVPMCTQCFSDHTTGWFM
jgi:hypothetical protein